MLTESSNPRSNKYLNYSHVQILAILSTDTRPLISPFSTSQLPKNKDKSSFKHFIEHLFGGRKIFKFKNKQDRLRLIIHILCEFLSFILPTFKYLEYILDDK